MKKVLVMSFLLIMATLLTGCTDPDPDTGEQTIISESSRLLIEQATQMIADSSATVEIGDVVGAVDNDLFSKDIVIDDYSFLTCPLQFEVGDVAVKFSDYNSRAWQGLVSNVSGGLSWRARLPWIYYTDVYVPPGKYDIYLATYDSYSTRDAADPARQQEEGVMLEMESASGYKVKTNPTGDLRDGYKTAMWIGMVNGEKTDDAYIIKYRPERIRVVHSQYYSLPTQWANSVIPICAIFKPKLFPEKECPFVATNPDDIVVNFNGTGIRSDKCAPCAEQIVDANIPKGNYKISLAAYDGGINRKNHYQDNESYYLKFQDNSGNLIGGQTAASNDLADNTNIAAWDGVVELSFAVPVGVSKLVAYHNAYPPDTSPNANSLTPICALFEKIPDCIPNWTYSCVESPDPVTCTYPQNCGQTLSIDRSCLKEDSNVCQPPESLPSSVCRVNNVACDDSSSIVCDTCPDVIDWVEIAP